MVVTTVGIIVSLLCCNVNGYIKIKKIQGIFDYLLNALNFSTFIYSHHANTFLYLALKLPM